MLFNVLTARHSSIVKVCSNIPNFSRKIKHLPIFDIGVIMACLPFHWLKRCCITTWFPLFSGFIIVRVIECVFERVCGETNHLIKYDLFISSYACAYIPYVIEAIIDNKHHECRKTFYSFTIIDWLINAS